MAIINHILLGLLMVQIYVTAAPSDVSKLEDIAAVIEADPKLEAGPKAVEDDHSSQGPRQKRWFNHYGYGFPPISPVIYPTYNKRDDSSNTGVFGVDDPFTQIHKRLQEIAHAVRQPLPQPAHIPIFYPVLFVPSADCGCNENPSTETPATTSEAIDRTPTVTSRWPEMEDERQNWGFVVNNTEDDDDEDFTRPISFEPIKPNKPLSRPPPPVEHGSVQSGGDKAEPEASVNDVAANLPNSQSSRERDEERQTPPSTCDGAILSCCHQLNVVYDCFANQGCSDLSSYGNPCDGAVIGRVIRKFQEFYGNRLG